MSEPETAAQPESQTESQPEPQPEPWTPERVMEWNAYYDLYVVLGVLLLAFAVSANKITNSSLWTQLRAGQTIAAQGAPLVTDPFSFTENGQRWVNIPWLFEWSQAELYKLAHGLVPRDPADPAASAAKADQVGAGALVGLNALARVLTALLILRIRRPGPGLWWSAVCVTLALGVTYSPAGLMLGGIALPGQVSPDTWGLLLLAIELLLLHRAIVVGRAGALWGLVPVFLLWANIDESFLVGLLLLAASVVGLLDRPVTHSRGKDRDEAEPAVPPSFGYGLLVLAACAAICLVNPSVHRAFGAAVTPLMSHFRPKTDVRTIEQISFFSPELRDGARGTVLGWQLIEFYVIVVGTGLASFVVNRRRFALGRFLTYTVAAVLWGYLIRYSGEFSLVFAVTLALNGQEWYHDRFGARGRLGRSWAVWSTGGRALTIVVVFLVVARALTGYGGVLGDLQFGFGYDPDGFEFEAADFMKNAPIKGYVLNTTRRQGDALLWRAYPQRPSFVDNRHNLFRQELLNELQELRGALKTNDTEKWKPLLDKHQVSAVMLDIDTSPVTYQQLMQTPDWVPFYDDGRVVMFGRSDVSADDVAYFRANRLDAEAMAYRLGKTVPPPERPPTQTTWMDEIFVGRSLSRPQPHDDAAKRWLRGQNFEAAGATLPTPAQCFLAIREARTALAHKPDDYEAFRILSECYRALMIQEAAVIQGITLNPKNAAQLVRATPNPSLVMNRFRQRVTVLNFAIQTTPPPRDAEGRRALQALNLDLFRLYASVNSLDLAKDHLEKALENSAPDDFPDDARAALADQLKQLKNMVENIKEKVGEFQLERQAGQLELAAKAIESGAPGVAIQYLEEADRTSGSPALVKPQLVDLYCETGQPEKAAEILGAGSADDLSLGGEPGMAALRQGQVYFLLGNYEDASLLWERRAIPQLRFDRSERALSQLQSLLRGNPKQMVTALATIPAKVGLQAAWEYDVGLCRLESGAPASAAEHFTKALELSPDLQTRRLAAYYLEKMGKPVPPSAAEKAKSEEADKGKKKADEQAKKADEPAKPAPASKDDGAEKTQEKPAEERK